MFFKKRFNKVQCLIGEIISISPMIDVKSITVRVTEKGSEAVFELVNTRSSVIHTKENNKETP